MTQPSIHRRLLGAASPMDASLQNCVWLRLVCAVVVRLGCGSKGNIKIHHFQHTPPVTYYRAEGESQRHYPFFFQGLRNDRSVQALIVLGSLAARNKRHAIMDGVHFCDCPCLLPITSSSC